jgi:hypothetical protein
MFVTGISPVQLVYSTGLGQEPVNPASLQGTIFFLDEILSASGQRWGCLAKVGDGRKWG